MADSGNRKLLAPQNCQSRSVFTMLEFLDLARLLFHLAFQGLWPLLNRGSFTPKTAWTTFAHLSLLRLIPTFSDRLA
jgi:hypothetical protein